MSTEFRTAFAPIVPGSFQSDQLELVDVEKGIVRLKPEYEGRQTMEPPEELVLSIMNGPRQKLDFIRQQGAICFRRWDIGYPPQVTEIWMAENEFRRVMQAWGEIPFPPSDTP